MVGALFLLGWIKRPRIRAWPEEALSYLRRESGRGIRRGSRNASGHPTVEERAGAILLKAV